MTDGLIIGGGISGLLTALQLHQAGLKVTLIDRSNLGQESSWASGGIISPLYPWRCAASINLLARWSQAHYPQFVDDLCQQTAIDSEYVRNGLLILDYDEYPQARAWAAEEQCHLESLEGVALRDCEPEMGSYDEALWLPEIGQIRTPRFLKALKQATVSVQLSYLEHCTVQSLVCKNGKMVGVHTNTQGFIAAERVIVTAGAWSAYLLSSVNTNLPVTPVRGQMILFLTQPGLISRIVLANDHYIIPRRDGHVLVGSTIEDVGFNKSTTQTALQDLKYAAFGLIPRLADYTVQKHWAGLRPSSPCGVPYISKHPNIEGLYINTGHFRNGIALGLAAAHLMADIVLERPPILDPSKYALTAERHFT